PWSPPRSSPPAIVHCSLWVPAVSSACRRSSCSSGTQCRRLIRCGSDCLGATRAEGGRREPAGQGTENCRRMDQEVSPQVGKGKRQEAAAFLAEARCLLERVKRRM